VVAAVCAAETLGLAGYSIVPALLPQFIDDWSLSNAQGGWLAGMVLAGYMLVNCLFGLVPELPYGTVVWLALIAGIICPGKLLQSHFGHACRGRSAPIGRDDGALFLHAVWRWFCRRAHVRRRTRGLAGLVGSVATAFL
jgi:hypothetical protein